VEVTFQVFSGIATFAALTVVLTAVAFPSMYKRLFMKIVVIISICDIIASTFSTIGFPSENSILCPMQAFFTIFGYKASWLWTTGLAFELYSVCIYGKFVPILYLHLGCWSIALLSTLLPLSTNGFGRQAMDDSESWCFINGSPRSGAIWAAVSFQVLLVMTSFVTLILTFRIYWRYRTMNIAKDYPEVYVILDTMVLYPIGFFITWGPNLVFSLLINFGAIDFSARDQYAFHVVTTLATQSGTVLAIIFFFKSKEARYRWLNVLYDVLSCYRKIPQSPSNVDLLQDSNASSNNSSSTPRVNSGHPEIISSGSSSQSLLGETLPIPIDFEDDDVYEKRFTGRVFSHTSSQSHSTFSSGSSLGKSPSTTLSKSFQSRSTTLNSELLSASEESSSNKRFNHLYWNSRDKSSLFVATDIEDNNDAGYIAGSDGDESAAYVKFG
jgi:hypothetical protein